MSYLEYDAFELNHEVLAMVRYLSCSLSCNKSSDPAAFFFRIVFSSLYAMLQELKFDESLLWFKNFKFLCLVELLKTDWRGCSEVCLLYAQGSMAHVKDMSNSNLVVPWHRRQAFPWHRRQALYLLKFGCLHQNRDPLPIPSYYNTMATRRYCEGFT